MILEWDNPWDLVTPAGTLPLNALASIGTIPLGYFLLDPAGCSAGVSRRITRSNIAQADGEIIHRKFKTGYVIELKAQLWEASGVGGVPACGGVLRRMADLLDLHLNAMENADGRIEWTPSQWSGQAAVGRRMLDKVRSLGPSGAGSSGFVSVATEKDSESPLTTVTFAMLSPLPYTEDVTQTDTQLAPAGAVVTNNGNVNFYPVLKVHGPTTAFTIRNLNATDDNGNILKLVYDSTLPGAVAIANGHYAEIDFFRNTVYLDGNGANLKAGIDVQNTDFWPLVPGPNVIDVAAYAGGGTSIEMLWQSAYS